MGEEDQDDMEIIEKSETNEVTNSANPLCASGYPPEELMDRFSEIVKGRTYLHQPNQALNLYLTATLVIVATLVLGLGLGHFLGWSERLELQEQYADIREERMDQLTESLVTCMTGKNKTECYRLVEDEFFEMNKESKYFSVKLKTMNLNNR